jgi:hypothetical protein
VGDAKIFGFFRVKNHDFTPKNHIFSNFRVLNLFVSFHLSVVLSVFPFMASYL